MTTHLRFDFDPLDLKDPTTESVSTLFDVMHDPDSGFYKIDILRPTLQQAQDLGAQLQKLPEVDHIMTLASFVPEDQETKLAMIADTRTLLGPTLSLPPLAPPDDDEVYDSLRRAAGTLHALETGHPSAARLATALDTVVARRDRDLLQRLYKNIVSVLQNQLNMARQGLDAGQVTVDSITEDLRRDWVTPDGRYMLDVYPKGGPPNQGALRLLLTL